MTDTKEPVERRKHERLQIEHGAFVIVQSHDRKVGRIVDISPEGLAFIYHTSGEGSVMATQLDIFVAGSPIHMYTIPYRIVSDFEIDSDIHQTAMWCAIGDAEAGPDISAQLFDGTQHHTGGEGQATQSNPGQPENVMICVSNLVFSNIEDTGKKPPKNPCR
jgi:hypothetical protein